MICFDWDTYFREYFLDVLMTTKVNTQPKPPMMSREFWNHLPNVMELYIDENKLMTLRVMVDRENEMLLFWALCLGHFVYRQIVHAEVSND